MPSLRRAPELTRDEKVRALVRVTGMPERRAETIIDGQSPEPPLPAAMQEVTLPVVLTLPWSHLVSDNDRYAFVGDKRLSDRYKAARVAIKALLRDTIVGVPVAVPVTLEAMVFVPDNRIHDVPDFAKGVHDAMARQVYTNDAWIYRAVWERRGVDVDRPRADITISHYRAHD